MKSESNFGIKARLIDLIENPPPEEGKRLDLQNYSENRERNSGNDCMSGPSRGMSPIVGQLTSSTPPGEVPAGIKKPGNALRACMSQASHASDCTRPTSATAAVTTPLRGPRRRVARTWQSDTRAAWASPLPSTTSECLEVEHSATTNTIGAYRGRILGGWVDWFDYEKHD